MTRSEYRDRQRGAGADALRVLRTAMRRLGELTPDPLAARAPGWLLTPDALDLWAMRRWVQSPVRQLPLP